jgi:hypothetical protein
MRAQAQAILAAVVLTSVTLTGTPAQAETKSYTATLRPEEEVPQPGPPGAQGTAKIVVDTAANQLCYELTWSGMPAPEAGHIHKGPKGAVGPPLIPLDPAKNGPKACIAVNPVLLQDLVADPSGHYVNLHTHDHSNGAIRGQLAPG